MAFEVKAIILAGGLGTRLRPMTDTLPKCLVPIAGRPLLGYWVDALVRAGVREARVSSHAHADQVRAYVKSVSASGRLRLDESYEPKLLGSAGTIAANADLADGSDVVVIVYADNFSDVDLGRMIAFHRSHDDPFTMLLFRAPVPSACGIAELDAEGRVVSFVEKPKEPRSDLANGGVYVVDADAYREIAAMGAFDIGFEVLPRFVERMRGWPWEGYHLDVGTHEALEKARRDAPGLAKRPGCPGVQTNKIGISTMSFLAKKSAVLALLGLSLLLNAMTVAYLAYSGRLRRIFVKLDLAELPKSRLDLQKEIETRYRKFPNTPAEIIFAGDSLVGDGPWAEYYSDIHNRGIGGETSTGILTRLDEITESKPRKIFLLLGTNDFAQGVPVAQFIRNYRAILERIRNDTPATSVYVIAVTPTYSSSPLSAIHNAKVAEANAQLKQLVAEFPGVNFADMTPYLADQDGQLRREFTIDGCHLNYDGYLAIREPLGVLVAEPQKISSQAEAKP